jgi:serine/threonine-protein kinase
MELLRGESLQTLIEQQGPFDWRRAKQLGLQIVAGLVAAHGAGVLHRDVKPGNVFILQTAQGERVKLIDFGISRAHTLSPDATALTNLGELIGTPAFMAPEQIHGRSVDVRSDIYAMGCLLYAMLVGQSPFLGSTTAETLYRQLYEDPPPLRSSPRGAEIPVSVEAVIQRALRKSPELRYPTMHDLYAALDAATATSAKTLVPNEILPMPSPELRARYRTEPSMSLPVPSQPLAPTQATAPKKRSSAAPWAAGAIVAVAAISATAWSLGVPSVGEQSPSTDPATVLPTPQEPEPSTAPPAHAPPPPPEVPSPTAVVESPVSQPPAVELDEGNDGVADSEPAVAAPAPRPRPRRPPRPSSPPATSELAPTAEPPPPQTQVPSGVRPSKGDKDSREDIKDPWGAGPKNPWANE